jgi:hypothetical protein
MADRTHLEVFRAIVYNDLCGLEFDSRSLRESGRPIPPNMDHHSPSRPAYSLVDEGFRQDGNWTLTTLKLTNHITGAVVSFEFDQFGQFVDFAVQEPTKSSS